jgi:Protein of unknown function (DUF3040)
MNDDQVSRTIEELERALRRGEVEAIGEVERGLAREDPAFVRRFRGLCRAEAAMAIAVFGLLAAGAVLLTVGLATVSWPSWVAGVAAFLASFGVNHHHDRMVGRASPPLSPPGGGPASGGSGPRPAGSGW